MLPRATAVLAVVLCAAAPAAADENSDLNLIPGAVQQAPGAAPATPANGKLFLENAFTLYGTRGAWWCRFRRPDLCSGRTAPALMARINGTWGRG